MNSNKYNDTNSGGSRKERDFSREGEKFIDERKNEAAFSLVVDAYEWRPDYAQFVDKYSTFVFKSCVQC